MKKILFVRTDRIGETLLVMPLIWYCQRLGSRVAFVGAGWCKEIKDLFPFVDEWFFVEKQGFSDAIFLGNKIRRVFQPEICIVFNPSKFGHLLSFSCGAGVRCGYNRKWSFLLNKTLEDKKDLGRHEVEYNLSLCSVGVGEVLKGDLFGILSEFRIWLREKLSKELDGKRIKGNGEVKMVIHPFSSDADKMVSFEIWRRLVSHFSDRGKYRFYVVGCKEERSLFYDELKSLCSYGNVVDLVGKLTLRQLFDVIFGADLFIGIDSAPMHIAGLLNVPAVGIYSKGCPVRWAVLSEKKCILMKCQLSAEEIVSSISYLIEISETEYSWKNSSQKMRQNIPEIFCPKRNNVR